MNDLPRKIHRTALLGLVLLALAFTTLTGALTWLAALVGVVFIATSAMSFCPLYPLIGLKTCRDC